MGRMIGWSAVRVDVYMVDVYFGHDGGSYRLCVNCYLRPGHTNSFYPAQTQHTLDGRKWSQWLLGALYELSSSPLV
jgi:hypothetical protein